MVGIAKEVKEEAIAKVKSGIPVFKVASQYGISDKTIYNWLKKKAISSISILQHNRLKRENRKLKEIVGILTLEVEKLKKRRISKDFIKSVFLKLKDRGIK